MTNNITREQGIIYGKSQWWLNAPDTDIVGFQLFEDTLCMNFQDFHEATERVLEHPILTHQFGTDGVKVLRKEFRNKYGCPTISGIDRFVPKEFKEVINKMSDEKFNPIMTRYNWDWNRNYGVWEYTDKDGIYVHQKDVNKMLEKSGKKLCPICEGSGEVEHWINGLYTGKNGVCGTCKGKGIVDIPLDK